MTSTKSIPPGTLQNTCVQRKRRARPHRPHHDPFLPDDVVMVQNSKAQGGWSLGLILEVYNDRKFESYRPTKYFVVIGGRASIRGRWVRRSLLKCAARLA